MFTLSSTAQMILQDSYLSSMLVYRKMLGPVLFLAGFTLLTHSLKWFDPFLSIALTLPPVLHAKIKHILTWPLSKSFTSNHKMNLLILTLFIINTLTIMIFLSHLQFFFERRQGFFFSSSRCECINIWLKKAHSSFPYYSHNENSQRWVSTCNQIFCHSRLLPFFFPW